MLLHEVLYEPILLTLFEKSTTFGVISARAMIVSVNQRVKYKFYHISPTDLIGVINIRLIIFRYLNCMIILLHYRK